MGIWDGEVGVGREKWDRMGGSGRGKDTSGRGMIGKEMGGDRWKWEGKNGSGGVIEGKDGSL